MSPSKKLLTWTPAAERALRALSLRLATTQSDAVRQCVIAAASSPPSLRTARLAQNLTQSALAALCGVRRSTVSNVEQGRWRAHGALAAWLAAHP